MSDQEAFLAAVAADPDDDLPRLVFADWCEENGDPARAEFIRLQCALARQPVPDTDLRLRSYDLLDANEHRWLDGVPDHGPVRAVSFDRGFVSKVWAASPEHFRRVAAGPPSTVRSVRFEKDSDRGTLPGDWADWVEVGDLRELEFSFYSFDHAQTELFVASPHVAGLRSLAIDYSNFDSLSMRALAASPRMANLTRLSSTLR